MVFGAFVIGTVSQEFWRGVRARRAMSSESVPGALVSLVQRNRRRYGGYLVHAGVAVLFIGVAASSAFQEARDARLVPGQTMKVDGYDIRYVRATSGVDGEKISFGAVLDVRRDGKHVATLRPTRGYYPSQDARGLGTVGRFFEGESTSEVGLRAGLRRDLWTAVSPDVGALKPFIDEADRRFANAPPRVQALLVGTLAARYQAKPPPATFRIIASPLVTWIWLGGLIVIAGVLVAIWPAPSAVRRRVRAGYAARVARELGRA